MQSQLKSVCQIILALIALVDCLPIPGNHRSKRQIFREDIPHHRPLTGATYHLHAGYPHPGRFNENSQLVVPPNPHHPSPPPPELAPNDFPDLDDQTNNKNHQPLTEIVSNELEEDVKYVHVPVAAVGASPQENTLGNLFPNLNAIWEVDNNEISGQVPNGSYSWNIRS